MGGGGLQQAAARHPPGGGGLCRGYGRCSRRAAGPHTTSITVCSLCPVHPITLAASFAQASHVFQPVVVVVAQLKQLQGV